MLLVKYRATGSALQTLAAMYVNLYVHNLLS